MSTAKWSGDSYVGSWTSYSMVITGVSANPTKGASASEKAFYRYLGPKTIQIHYTYSDANSSGAAAGTGVYLFSLPSGVTIDNTIMAVSSSQSLSIAGFCKVGTSATNGVGIVEIYDTTHLYIGYQHTSTYDIISDTIAPLNGTNCRYNFQATLAIL